VIRVHCPHCGARDCITAMMTDDEPEREECGSCGEEYVVTITATKETSCDHQGRTEATLAAPEQ